MKRCFAMFVFFVLMLVLAALTDNSNNLIKKNKIVENELAAEIQLTNEVITDNALKN